MEDDPLLAKQRSQKQQKKMESSDTATIKKLHVSSANLQRVSFTGLLMTIVEHLGLETYSSLTGLLMTIVEQLGLAT